MKKKFTNMERRGLAGGPNEMFTYVTGVFSTEGYRKDSPDVNNLFNIIASKRKGEPTHVSMRENNGDPLEIGEVLGIDTFGNQQIMYPGGEYIFPGDQVLEIPMFTHGGPHDPPDKKPLFVTDKNDPRLLAFQDSLSLYNQGAKDRLTWKTYGPIAGTAPYWRKIVEEELPEGYVVPNQEIQPIGRKVTRAAFPGWMTVDGSAKGGGRKVYKSIQDTYAKPQQPVFFGDETNPDYIKYIQDEEDAARKQEIINKQQQLIDAGFKIGKADGIWGPKSDAAWAKFVKKQDVLNSSPVLVTGEGDFLDKGVAITPDMIPEDLMDIYNSTPWVIKKLLQERAEENEISPLPIIKPELISNDAEIPELVDRDEEEGVDYKRKFGVWSEDKAQKKARLKTFFKYRVPEFFNPKKSRTSQYYRTPKRIRAGFYNEPIEDEQIYPEGFAPILQGGGWLARYLRDIQPEYEYTFARPGVADPTMGPNFLARSFIGNTTNPRKSYLAMDADVGYATNANLDPYYGNFPLFGGLGLNYIGPRIGTSPVRASLDLEARYAPYKGVMGQFRAAPQIDFKSAKLPNPFNYVKGYVHPFGASYGIGSRPYQWGIENTLPENVNPYNVTSLETEPYSANWGFYSKLLAELGIGNKRSPFSIFGELSLNYDPVKGKADESYSQEVFDFATQSQGKLSTAITPQFRIGVKLDPEKGRSLKDKALLRIEEKKREEEQADRERREREYIESLSNTSEEVEEVEEVIDKPESRLEKLRRRRREKQEAKREAEKEMVRHPRFLQDGKEVSTFEDDTEWITVEPRVTKKTTSDRWKTFKREVLDPAEEKADNIIREAVKEINKPIGLKGEMFTLQDNRKINATSGEAINPNRDLFTGQYNFDLIKKIVDRSKKEGVDPYQMIAIGLQESQLGKTDNNVGHILYGEGIEKDPLGYISFFKDKMKTADRLGIEDEATRIQAYNGLGMIKPDTEKSYHGYRMDSIYGVPLTEAGIDMKKNPLYGKRILDLANNVIMQNKMIRDYVEGNKQKEGGQIDSYKVYKDYVNGAYDNTDELATAEAIYDKLNRIHYKEAKESGMSVPNYIMTNIIKPGQ